MIVTKVRAQSLNGFLFILLPIVLPIISNLAYQSAVQWVLSCHVVSNFEGCMDLAYLLFLHMVGLLMLTYVCFFVFQ